MDLSRVTRVTVVGPQGIEYENYDLYTDGADLFLQDEGRTLKVFPRQNPTPR